MLRFARQLVRSGGERIARAIAPDMAGRSDFTRGMGLGYGIGGGVGGGAFKSTYEAGKITRRDPDFTPQGLGPNAMAEVGNLDMVVRRCRDLADNNPLVDGAVHARVNAVVGTGLTWFPDTPWDDVNDQLSERQELHARRVDPERQLSIADSQRLACREIQVAGEVTSYYPIVEPFGGHDWGVAIELIARERIPLDLHGVLNSGNVVRQGVEYDHSNRVVAYHILTHHPRDAGHAAGFGGAGGSGWGGWGGSYMLGSPNLVRVPAERCELMFADRRIEQLRGVPRMVTVINTIRMEDGFQDDAMVGARLQTAYAICIPLQGNLSTFMSKRDQKLMNGQEPAALDANMRPVQRIEPGGIIFYKAGSEPKTIQPTLPGQQFPAIEEVLQRRIAKGIGGDYATVSGDSSKSNFSASRMDALTTRADCEPEMRMIWDHHTDPWRRATIRLDILRGKIRLTGEQLREIERHSETLFRCRVGFRGNKYVNPAQESTANATDINTGIKSEIQAISELGGDFKSIARELARWELTVRNERIKLGLPPERPKQGISGGAAPTSGGENKKESGEESGDTNDESGSESRDTGRAEDVE